MHPLGFILFWTKQHNLLAYNFMGDLFFKTPLKMGSPEEKVTQFRLFSSDKSLLLFSSDRGAIYSVDIFDVYRYCKTSTGAFPMRSSSDLLAEVAFKTRPAKPSIVDFTIDWDSKPYWKVLALYEGGELCYFLNQGENTQRVRQQMAISQLVL